MSSSVLDRAMDAFVVPGYTRIGFGVRRRGWDRLPSMAGRTVAVTGGTSGLGRAACVQLAGLGARVLLVARDPERGAKAVREVQAEAGAGTVELVVGDLGSIASTRAAAADITSRVDVLDALIHNAGAYVDERTESVDGVELTFATNVLGPFVLTAGLLDALKAGPGRIVTVSSGGAYTQPLAIDDLQFEGPGYTGGKAYARTKRAEIVLTELWARRYWPLGIVAHAMHPGWADTPGVAASLPGFRRLTRPLLRTADEGADTMVWLAAAPEPLRSSGGFWHDRRERPKHRSKGTREAPGDAERLWDALEALAAQVQSP